MVAARDEQDLDPVGDPADAVRLSSEVFLRLLPETDVAGTQTVAPACPVPGLAQVLVRDLPDQVATVPPRVAEALGTGRLLDAARGNLAALARSGDLSHQVLAGEGTSMDVVDGESYFVASLAAVLPDLLDRFAPGAREHGVFVVVPHRHMIAWHVLRGVEGLRSAQALFELALRDWDPAFGLLSHHLYWAGSISRCNTGLLKRP